MVSVGKVAGVSRSIFGPTVANGSYSLSFRQVVIEMDCGAQ